MRTFAVTVVRDEPMQRPTRTLVASTLMLCLVACLVPLGSRGQEPVRDQGKPEQKKDDKKKPPPDKEKPLVDVGPPPPVSRLEFVERRLPLAPEMLGDQPPPFLSVPPRFVPPPTIPRGQPAGIVPGTRGFKVADNGSPRPQDRIYVNFNYFDDMFAASNLRAGADLRDVRLYREAFGIEKTFLAGTASFELRLPLHTVSMHTADSNLNGTSSDLGDLSMVLRYALWRDVEQDNWLTAGLAVTVPSGPDSIANIEVPHLSHSTILQPFVGVLWNVGNFYVQGFSALDVPTDSSDVTLFFNDVGLGYFLYRSEDADRFLTAVAPCFEVHVTTPLNHRGPLSQGNPLTAPDEVDLSFVANFEFRNRTRLAAGIVTPVTGPRPFNVEAIVQLRLRY